MIIVLKPHTSDESIKKIEDVIRARAVSYTHLDVYKRQIYTLLPILILAPSIK